MKTCPFCNAHIEDSARFCIHCMKPLCEKEHIVLRKEKSPSRLLLVSAVVGVALVITFLLSVRQSLSTDKIPVDSLPLTSALSSATTTPVTASPVPSADESPPQPSESVTQSATSPSTTVTASHTTSSVGSGTFPSLTSATKSSRKTTTTTSHTTATTARKTPTTAHKHSFVETVLTAKFLKSAATCTTPAVYYHSCSCGEKGTTTFSAGLATGHSGALTSGYPASCDSSGLSDKEYCTVCFVTLKEARVLPPTGHIFTLGSSSPACLSCGARSAHTLAPFTLPVTVGNTFRINSGTYRFNQRNDASGMWSIVLKINYTNISSARTSHTPAVSMSGCVTALCEGSTLNPNESGILEVQFMSSRPPENNHLTFE